MDRRQRQVFMEVASEVGPLSLFRRGDGSLKDFLDHHGDDMPDVVGARIIEYFSLDNGRFNNFLPGVQLAMSFLDRVLGGPADSNQRQQAARDLKAILDGQGNFELILEWVRSHYR
jgi:hypothetical protein